METKIANISGYTVICDDDMPKNTILVGRDIYDFLKDEFPDLSKIFGITFDHVVEDEI